MTTFRKYLFDTNNNIYDEIICDGDADFSRWDNFYFQQDKYGIANKHFQEFARWAEDKNLLWGLVSVLAENELYSVLAEKLGPNLANRLIEKTERMLLIEVYNKLHSKKE